MPSPAFATARSAPQGVPHAVLATQWLARCTSAGSMPAEVTLPEQPLQTLAALVTLVVGSGQTMLILVPDEEPLPELSTALDLTLRPLCLVLPAAEFAARIALRATLSLLKSRLARASEDEHASAWSRQRELIASNTSLLQAASDWSARNDRSPWPSDIGRLFPARILPIAAYRGLPSQAADVVVFYRCDLGLETATLAGRHLHVGQRQSATADRALAVNDETARLRQELNQLTQDVADLELELATAQAEMAEFTHHYFEHVGTRMTELDRLRARLASLRAATAPDDTDAQREAERLSAEAAQSARESERFRRARDEDGQTTEAPAFRPSQDLKRLFRQLAQKIHPDRAQDEADRAWRTQLMSEANRAYRAADAQALSEVAALWDEGPPRDLAHVGTAPTSGTPPKNALMGQIERMRQRFRTIETELNRLFGSRLYELFAAARQALRQGRDLLREMADSLDAQISDLRRTLEATEATG